MTPAQLEQVAQLVAQLVTEQHPPAPWLDKRGLAAHLACSIRSIETAMSEGMPHAVIFGRAKFRPTDVEAWLTAHGDLRLEGYATSVEGPNKNGAAPLGTARPRHPGDQVPDANEA